MSYYPSIPYYNNNPSMYDPYYNQGYSYSSPYAPVTSPYYPSTSYGYSPNYAPYYNYYREPNVLNRLLNRARYGTGSYFGNPYLHTRVTFDPQGNRIWPEGNYVSSVKDLWKTSDPYATP